MITISIGPDRRNRLTCLTTAGQTALPYWQIVQREAETRLEGGHDTLLSRIQAAAP